MATTDEKRTEKYNKDFMLRVRLDNGTLERLDTCCDTTGKSRSEVVRNGIDRIFRDLKKRKG